MLLVKIKTFQPKRRIDPITKLFYEFHEFFEMFSEKEINKWPPYRPFDQKINFIEKIPKYGFLYSISQKKIQILKKKINENLIKSSIRTNSSTTKLPTLFIRKPGVNFRICVNYKTFNKITMKNKYPLPLIQEIINRSTKTKYFTKLNIIAVFTKFKMAENEKWKTVFRIEYGLFESLFKISDSVKPHQCFKIISTTFCTNIWIQFILGLSTTFSFTAKLKKEKFETLPAGVPKISKNCFTIG